MWSSYVSGKEGEQISIQIYLKVQFQKLFSLLSVLLPPVWMSLHITKAFLVTLATLTSQLGQAAMEIPK